MLSDLDIRLLQIIELSPTITIRELAIKANTSWVTAKKHLQKLRKAKILSNPIAVFNSLHLGLERHVIFFKAASEKEILQLEQACDLHPYTHYRSRIYGPFAGVFAQFDIPPKAELLLHRFFQELQKMGISKGYVMGKSTGYRLSTTTNLQKYDSTSMSWKYDWYPWLEEICSVSNKLPDIALKNEPVDSLPSGVELEILRRMTANADVSQSELEAELSLSQSTISRKMILVRENYIDSIRAQIDRSRFDISSTKLFYCPDASDDNRATIYNALLSKLAPPFPLAIDLLERGGFLLWGRMPPSHEHSLFYALWTKLPSLQVFTMDTVRNHSRLYWFYPENISAEGNWKSDDEWLLHEPLRELQKHY